MREESDQDALYACMNLSKKTMLINFLKWLADFQGLTKYILPYYTHMKSQGP